MTETTAPYRAGRVGGAVILSSNGTNNSTSTPEPEEELDTTVMVGVVLGAIVVTVCLLVCLKRVRPMRRRPPDTYTMEGIKL